jgi:hypothetical protein
VKKPQAAMSGMIVETSAGGTAVSESDHVRPGR